MTDAEIQVQPQAPPEGAGPYSGRAREAGLLLRGDNRRSRAPGPPYQIAAVSDRGYGTALKACARPGLGHRASALMASSGDGDAGTIGKRRTERGREEGSGSVALGVSQGAGDRWPKPDGKLPPMWIALPGWCRPASS
jgi:hypothetical protein